MALSDRRILLLISNHQPGLYVIMKWMDNGEAAHMVK
jgi:hypothetical protein